MAMNTLLLSKHNDNAYILGRLSDEKHTCYRLQNTKSSIYGLEVTPEQALNLEVDTILVDGPGLAGYANSLAEKCGAHVWGASVGGDAVEDDPVQATVMAAKARVLIDDTYTGGQVITLAAAFNRTNILEPVLAVQELRGLYPSSVIPTTEGVQLKSLNREHILVQKTFMKLSSVIAALGHRGWVFLDVEVKDGEPHILRLRTHPPEGFWSAFLCGLDPSDAERFTTFLEAGDRSKTRRPATYYRFTEKYVGSLRLSLPPWPYSECPWISDDLARSLVEQYMHMGAAGIPLLAKRDVATACVDWHHVELHEEQLVSTGSSLGWMSGTLDDDPDSLITQVPLLLTETQRRQPLKNILEDRILEVSASLPSDVPLEWVKPVTKPKKEKVKA